jgi:hypothetical protein
MPTTITHNPSPEVKMAPNPNRPLDAFDLWAINSNLKRIKDGESTPENTINTLKANGYHRWAAEVEKQLRELKPRANVNN